MATPGAQQLNRLPGLRNIASGENFGLVVSSYTNTFKGLLEIKQELQEDQLQVLDDEFDPDDVLKSLNIDPGLLVLPQAAPTPKLLRQAPPESASPVLQNISASSSTPGDSPSVSAAPPTAKDTSNKRKYNHASDELTKNIGEADEPLSSLAKKPRTEVSRQPMMLVSVNLF